MKNSLKNARYVLKMKYIFRTLKFYCYKFLGKFMLYFKCMNINQDELQQYLQNDISNFIVMEYGKSSFIVEKISLITLPNAKNYVSIPYKLIFKLKHQGKRFKVTVEYYLGQEDIKYGLQFYENEDYGTQASNIANLYGYIQTSQKLVKQLLNSTRLPE